MSTTDDSTRPIGSLGRRLAAAQKKLADEMAARQAAEPAAAEPTPVAARIPSDAGTPAETPIEKQRRLRAEAMEQGSRSGRSARKADTSRATSIKSTPDAEPNTTATPTAAPEQRSAPAPAPAEPRNYIREQQEARAAALKTKTRSSSEKTAWKLPAAVGAAMAAVVPAVIKAAKQLGRSAASVADSAGSIKPSGHGRAPSDYRRNLTAQERETTRNATAVAFARVADRSDSHTLIINKSALSFKRDLDRELGKLTQHLGGRRQVEALLGQETGKIAEWFPQTGRPTMRQADVLNGLTLLNEEIERRGPSIDAPAAGLVAVIRHGLGTTDKISDDLKALHNLAKPFVREAGPRGSSARARAQDDVVVEMVHLRGASETMRAELGNDKARKAMSEQGKLARERSYGVGQQGPSRTVLVGEVITPDASTPKAGPTLV